ncbi:MAG: MBL fold metallo-hydrolase [Anaerolineae bacterium]
MIIKIKLPLSNAYLIKGDQPVLVDTGSPGDIKRLEKALAREGLAFSDLAVILHTHAHGDHAGSTHEIAHTYNIATALHPADNMMARTGRTNPTPTRLAASIMKPFVNKPFMPFSPEIALYDGFSLAEYGIPARVIHTPGHTPGSVSVLFQNGQAIVGDVMMGGHMGGFFQPTRPRYHYFAEDLNAVHQSIHRLLALNVEEFYVGHGGPLMRKDVLARFSLVLPRVVGIEM